MVISRSVHTPGLRPTEGTQFDAAVGHRVLPVGECELLREVHAVREPLREAELYLLDARLVLLPNQQFVRIERIVGVERHLTRDPSESGETRQFESLERLNSYNFDGRFEMREEAEAEA